MHYTRNVVESDQQQLLVESKRRGLIPNETIDVLYVQHDHVYMHPLLLEQLNVRKITVNGNENPLTITKAELLALKNDPKWIGSTSACDGIAEDFILTLTRGYEPSEPSALACYAERDYIGEVPGYNLRCKLDVVKDDRFEVSFFATAKDGSHGFGSF